MNKKYLVAIIIFLVMVLLVINFLNYVPNKLWGCVEVTNINNASDKSTFNDRASTCCRLRYGGYDTFNDCMLGFQKFAYSSSKSTGYVCSKKSFLIGKW